MYKNFSLTDKERKQILEMHQSKGYKKPMNEDINQNNLAWEKISKLSNNYYEAIENLNDVGCDDSERYAEYYHSSDQMEPEDHDDRDHDDRDYDNGYSHSQQSWNDRLDYANDSDDPITRAERRMGA